VKDMRSILRLTYGQGLSVRAVSERLKLSKTTVSTYVLRAREAGLAAWPLPPGYDDDAALEQLLFRRVGRPPQDLSEPDWPVVAREIKRKGVTLTQGKIERWHQTLKNRILLENYFLPGDLETQIEAFVEHYNHRRYHGRLAKHDDWRSKWAQELQSRAGHNKTLVAMANKTARMAWAMLRSGENYKIA